MDKEDGMQPNMCEYGCSSETQNDLMKQVNLSLYGDFSKRLRGLLADILVEIGYSSDRSFRDRAISLLKEVQDLEFSGGSIVLANEDDIATLTDLHSLLDGVDKMDDMKNYDPLLMVPLDRSEVLDIQGSIKNMFPKKV